MNISVVIPVFNGRELLKRYFPSVVAACREYSIKKTELIVVDDASADGSGDYVRAEFPFVRIIRSESNKGFSGAANSGIFAARNRIVVLFNDDIEATGNFFAAIPRHFEYPAVFAVRAGLKGESGTDTAGPRIGGRFRLGSFAAPLAARPSLQYAFFAGGGAAAYDKDKFMELGGFDELFSPFYWEDVDLSYRAWKRGWKVVYEPGSVVYHQGGATINKFYNRAYIASIAERNKYFLVWKNVSDIWLLFQHMVLTPVRIAGSVLKGNLAPFTGFIRALKHLKTVLIKRRAEKRFWKAGDREIFGLFRN
ncbi:MAG: glycosyltransferase family 2 protein [Elusimicrobia bacterium]|nr:glycosyltransferase family 2 protein [Elusimicrobiota bacterium]